MSDCSDVGALITPYVEGALSSGDTARVERHVECCAPCCRQLLEERTIRATLRARSDALSAHQQPTSALAERCRALTATSAVPTRRSPRVAVSAMAALAAGLVAAIFVLQALSGRSTAVLAAQLAADHVKCFTVFKPNTATGANPRMAERQLAAHGWQMQVPASVPDEGVRLLGARRCLYAKGTMPHVMYEVNGRPVSLFKLPGVRPAQVLTSVGHVCRVWQRDGCTFVLVAQASAGAELARVAGHFEREAR